MAKRKINNICVFCGSSPSAPAVFIKAAEKLGGLIASKNFSLVYGGGNFGVMGALSREVLKNHGGVIGIIPKKLYDMVDHVPLTELHIVKTMHQRKSLMYKKSDAFIALPGGIGTLEEFFEAFTWLQLGFHLKPVALLNTGNYYGHLLRFLEEMVKRKFLAKELLDLLIVEKNPKILIEKILAKKVKYILKFS